VSGSDDGGFLSRWARRKQETQRREAQPPVASPAEPVRETEAPTALEAAERPLPSLDSVVPGADVAAFFQPHVPDALRKAALRKLWTTDPEIAGFIEMADYQWDFNNPDSIPGWGATLEGVDVQRLVGRLFGSPEQTEEARSESLSGRVSPTGPDTEQSDAAEVAAELPLPGPEAPDLSRSCDVAAQDLPDSTSGYRPSQKRHGGALPT